VGIAGGLPYNPYDPIVPVEDVSFEQASPFYTPALASEALMGAPMPLPGLNAPDLISRPPLNDASYQMVFDAPQEYGNSPFKVGI
jgi:hypothetical protein